LATDSAYIALGKYNKTLGRQSAFIKPIEGNQFKLDIQSGLTPDILFADLNQYQNLTSGVYLVECDTETVTTEVTDPEPGFDFEIKYNNVTFKKMELVSK
jgi:hypothetical protein